MSASDPDKAYDEEEGGSLLPEFLFDPLGAARRRWLPMVICGAIGLVVTVVAFATWKPIYQAYATVLITGQQIPGELVTPTVPNDTLDNVNAMVGQVLSVENISDIIDELGLFPATAMSVPRIDLVNRVKSNIEHGPERGASRRGRNEALVYGLAYTSPDPDEAAAVTNALASLFVEASFNRRNQQARQTTEFLRQELERNEEELRRQSALVAEFRREHRGQLPGELDTNLRKLDMLAARQAAIGIQISDKENRILTLSSRGGDGPLSEDEELLGELRRELARETAVHTDEHPNVIALRDRISRLQSATTGDASLSPAQRAIIGTERRDIERLKDELIEIQQKLSEIDVRVDVTPKVAEELAALEQREQVMREGYLQSMRKVEAAELAESLESARQGGQVSVLDAAQRPTSPLHPRWIVVLGGIAGSVALALAIAVLLELVDPVIVGPRQIEKLSNRPVLGSLPNVA